MDSQRYFKNEAEDSEAFDEFIYQEDGEVKIKEHIKLQLKTALHQILKDIEHEAESFGSRDVSVYTGTSGLALLYLHLYNLFGEKRHLTEALKYVEAALSHLKGRRITFLCGDAGPLAIGAVTYHISGKSKKSSDCVEKLMAMLEPSTSTDDVCDELLYGRSGYLYSLLYVNKNISPTAVPAEAIEKVVSSIIDSGKRGSTRKGSAPALPYEWHSKGYIGAAHGYVGILHTLLQAGDSTNMDLVKSTTEFVLGLQYPTGNFPSSLGSENDRLIHWCHGAPGGVYLMIKAYQQFGDRRYLDSAHWASDAVWKRGLLKKGYGLCHGASGNGFGFLAMYDLTNDTKYLFRAVQFGLWCCGYRERLGLNTPDRPFSLFEGIAGAAYFLASLLDFKNAKFPAFEL